MPKGLAESPATPRALKRFHRYCDPANPALVLDLIPEDDDDEYCPLSKEKSAKEIQRENVQGYLLQIAKEANVDLTTVHFTTRGFRKLAVSTQRKRIRGARKVLSAVCEAFAPDDPDYFQELLFDKKTRLDAIMMRTLESFRNAPSAIARQQVLSLIAPFVPLSDLHIYMPGLSPHYYKRARLFSKLYKPGAALPPKDTKRQKVSEKQLTTLIQFITSPPVVIDLPFGVATVTSSAGVKEEIPRVVRMQVNERIYQQYLAYMQETNQHELLLSRSTVLRILHYCPATTRKSLRGLDYFSFAGSEGFSMLARIADNLGAMSDDQEWSKDAINRLNEAKRYLKTDYRLHIKKASRVPDHCIAFALSDPKNLAFKESMAHEHDLRCDRCEALNNVLEDIRNQIDETNFVSDFAKQETLYDYGNAVHDILEMKKHIMRTLRQDQARAETLAMLEQNAVYITLDWAMKFIPMSGTEAQSDWFGKRGISWHITHVTARDPSDRGYRTRIYVHVFDSVAQDSKAIISILDSTLEQIKKELPHITQAFLRSDNAGCYHGAETIAAIPQISTDSKIVIKRWDFSDPQSGKGACDRAAAVIKRQVILFAAENHKCRNAEEFVKCANSYSGVKSATFFHVKIEVKKRTKPKISGITQYNNFEYLNFHDPPNADIVVWRAYKIGPGLKLPRKSWRSHQLSVPMWYIGTFTEGHANLESITDARYWKQTEGSSTQDYCSVDTAEACLVGDETSDDSDSNEIRNLLFPCPEAGCTKTYQSHSALQTHMERGNHQYKPELLSLRDAAIGAYKRELEGLQLPQDLPSITEALQGLLSAQDVSTPALEMGWALRTRKATTTFNVRQRAYLTAKFDHGERTGRKLDPQTVAKQMRSEFPKEEWLKWNQIASYWSRLARVRRGEALSDLAADDDDDEVDQATAAHDVDIEDDPYFNTPEDDMYDEIRDNQHHIFE
jgi:hypothetical protein